MIIIWSLAQETNNQLKPDNAVFDSTAYHYGEVFAVPPPRYYKANVSGTVFALLLPGDRFEIFSYAAQTRATAIGLSDMSGVFGTSVNLQTVCGYMADHYYHSRQFRANIVVNQTYWQKIAQECALPLTLPTP